MPGISIYASIVGGLLGCVCFILTLFSAKLLGNGDSGHVAPRPHRHPEQGNGLGWHSAVALFKTELVVADMHLLYLLVVWTHLLVLDVTSKGTPRAQSFFCRRTVQ